MPPKNQIPDEHFLTTLTALTQPRGGPEVDHGNLRPAEKRGRGGHLYAKQLAVPQCRHRSNHSWVHTGKAEAELAARQADHNYKRVRHDKRMGAR